MKRAIIGAILRYLLVALFLTALTYATASRWILAGVILMLVLPVASWAINWTVRKRISVTFSLPTSAAKRGEVACTVHVHNRSIFPVLRYFCMIRVHNDLTGEQEKLVLTGGVGARRETAHSFMLCSEYCGRLTVSVASFTLMDYFGLLPVKAPAMAEARTTVLPDLFPVDAQMANRPAYSDDGAAARKGDDRSEVLQFREYQAGDDVRQIHWKLSSKLDQLILKEASLPESRSLLVFWDKRVQGTPAQMDALAEAVSSVCGGLVQSGIQFCLSWTDQDELQVQEIPDETALLQAIPSLVKTVGSGDCRSANMEDYSRGLYFGLAPDQEMQKDERIHFMICSNTGSEIPNGTVFTAQNYQEKLQRLEV